MSFAALPIVGQVQGGFLNALSNVGTTFVQHNLNQKAYKQQRKDAIEFWHMQNRYNTPAEQMRRYQEAGLNPNLIYGQSNTAGPINQPTLRPVEVVDPRPGDYMSSAATDMLNAVYNLELKQAQIDNVKAQNEVIQQEGLLKAQQVKRYGFDLDFDQELRTVSADYRRARLQQVNTDIRFKENEDARRALLTAKNLEQAAELMLNYKQQRLNMAQQRKQSNAEILRIRTDIQRQRQQIELMKKDGTLKELDINLRKKGINPNDPMWSRFLGQFLSDIGDPNSEMGINEIINFLFK